MSYWTKTFPTVSGFYWHRLTNGTDLSEAGMVQPVWINADTGVMCILKWECDCAKGNPWHESEKEPWEFWSEPLTPP